MLLKPPLYLGHRHPSAGEEHGAAILRALALGHAMNCGETPDRTELEGMLAHFALQVHCRHGLRTTSLGLEKSGSNICAAI